MLHSSLIENPHPPPKKKKNIYIYGSLMIALLTVLEIKKKSRLPLFQKPGNQTCEFGCPDESLVVC